MQKLIFLLEEPSAQEFLSCVVKRLGIPFERCIFFVFNGKSDLENKIKRFMQGWREPDSYFLVMRDRDSGVCTKIKEKLHHKCLESGVSENRFKIRIACGELESFYLGDLTAVSLAFNKPSLKKQQNSRKFRKPDDRNNAAQEFFKLLNSPPSKVHSAKLMGEAINLEHYENNHSASFCCLIKTLLDFKNRLLFK